MFMKNIMNFKKNKGLICQNIKAKLLKFISYPVYNYDGYENKDCIKCNILICDGILIGGDVCSVEIGGFMQGLRKD